MHLNPLPNTVGLEMLKLFKLTILTSTSPVKFTTGTSPRFKLTAMYVNNLIKHTSSCVLLFLSSLVVVVLSKPLLLLEVPKAS